MFPLIKHYIDNTNELSDKTVQFTIYTSLAN